MTTYLKFPTEDDARQAFSPWILDEYGGWPAYIGAAAVDVVGVISVPTGELALDADGLPYPLYTALPGYHINLSGPVPELAEWEIAAPATPTRVFATAEPQPPRVPAEVARWQAKVVLVRAGLWDRLLNLRADMTEDENSILLDAALYETLNWRRASPTVEWAAQQLGLGAAEVDDLFIEAGQLEL